MKTERRHELETNVLANSLSHWTDAVQPYAKTVLAGILAIVVALLAWVYIASQNRGRTAEGWNEYFSAVNNRDEQMLQDVSEKFGGTMVAEWSRLTLGDWRLDSGTNRLLTDRTLGREQLQEASETYQSVILQSSEDTIKQRATFGLARAREARGELEKAREAYKSLADNWPESPFAAAAKQRAVVLESQPTKQFYDWLAKYEPPKPLSGEPGTPGARPDFLQEPDAGTLTPPSSLAEPAASFPDLSKDPTAEPASTPELPAAETPVSEPSEAPASEPAPE